MQANKIEQARGEVAKLQGKIRKLDTNLRNAEQELVDANTVLLNEIYEADVTVEYDDMFKRLRQQEEDFRNGK